MTYAKASLILRNKEAYKNKEIREAAAYILESKWAEEEDLRLAKRVV